MTREEVIERWVIPALKNTWNEKKCDEILKALEQEPCNDCISRQAAIAVADYADYIGLAIEDVKKVTDEIVKGLKVLPPVTPAQKWIPVSERLPKDSADVLATDGQLIFIAWYEDKERTGWYSVDKFYNPYTPILAWMPLPEPYKEVEDENND